jgi:hypothetical protein
MKWFEKHFAVLMILILFSSIRVSAAEPGKTGFSFLKVSPGARNAAMGDIGVAVTSNLYGVYFNPAVISGIKETWVGFMHHENIFDSRREFVGVATPLLGGALSVGLDYFKIGSIESREGPTEQPLGTFDARDILVYGAVAVPVSERLSLGGTVKYAAERIESQTASALLIDLGARFRPTEKLSIGFAGRNIGSSPKFETEKFDVPVTFSGGVDLEAKDLTVGIEVSKPKNDDVKVNLGLERYIVEFLSLRAGYKLGYDEENMAFGVGFAKSIWRVDYAFVPFKSGLGTNHRFALTVQFK